MRGYLTAYPQGGSAPLASNVNFQAGETVASRAVVALSGTGQIDIVANTTTDVIVDVAGYYGSSGSSYTPMTPTRIADTRCATSPQPPACGPENLPSQNAALGPLGPAGDDTLAVAGLASVPADATAVVLNVTAVDTTSGSYLTAWPTGQARPTASDLNWSRGATVANLAVVEVGANGAISLYNNFGSTDVVIDIEGYFS